jgi:YggT family protein
MPILLYIVVQLIGLLTWIVIIDVFLSYFLAPYHPVRMALDRLVEPMLAPLRGVIPPISGIDFSPLALIIILQILRQLVIVLFS